MAAEGSDNPILDMGLLGMMQPNPFLNPSLNYNPDGSPKPLKLPGFYTGQAGGNMPPTDAYGKPVQSFVDANAAKQAAYQAQLASFNPNQTPPPGTTTLNATGQTPQVQTSGSWPGQAQGAAAPGSLMATPAMQELMANYAASPEGKAMANNPNAPLMGYIQSQDQNIQAYPQGGSSGFGSGNSGPLSAAQRDMMTNNAMTLQQLRASGGGAPAGGATPPSPPDTRQDYLDALSNPGPPMKVGAAVPASQPLGVPSVMNAFMAAHPSGGAKSAGGYDNTGFFNTLSNLRSA